MSFDASSPVGADVSLDAGRARQAQRATWVSIAVNVVLTVFQIAVGLFAHAQSLVADGMHTLSDLVGDFMVLFQKIRPFWKSCRVPVVRVTGWAVGSPRALFSEPRLA